MTTVPMSLRFVRNQIPFMRERGYDVQAISSPGSDLQQFGAELGIAVYGVEMPRRITPLRDVAAVVNLARTLRRVRPHIVHAHTPKGGLLGMIAAWMARVPVRIYHMRGLPMMEATGVRRGLLELSERVACGLAHRVFCVGESLRAAAVAEGLCPPERILVAAAGSGQGVDAEGRFDPDTIGPHVRRETRSRLHIPERATVIGFVGRLVRDKGIVELEQAWRALAGARPDLHLLLVGPFEPQDPVPPDVRQRLEHDPRIHLTGLDWDTPPLYAAMDVCALPSYREGFPNAPLEAAAMRLPVVATRVVGCIDAVADGVTGTLVPARDVDALARALAHYLNDPALRERHGSAGRARALQRFREAPIHEAIEREYRSLLSSHEAVRTGRHARGDFWKRILDLVVSAVGLLVLAPLLALVALAVRIGLGAPVLFRQTRPGLHGRPFTLYKFRTMRDATDARGRPLPDAERLGRLGRVLRQTSLDELPELFNVLRGDMSLVGPRPLLMEYLPLYTPRETLRHDVRPGITGWAQVNGRNALDWDRRLEMDVWYVENRSLLLDLRILARTVGKVLRGSDVSQPGRATVDYLSDKRRPTAPETEET